MICHNNHVLFWSLCYTLQISSMQCWTLVWFHFLSMYCTKALYIFIDWRVLANLPHVCCCTVGVERSQEGDASDETEEAEFFDAMEDSPAFITVTTTSDIQHKWETSFLYTVISVLLVWNVFKRCCFFSGAQGVIRVWWVEECPMTGLTMRMYVLQASWYQLYKLLCCVFQCYIN